MTDRIIEIGELSGKLSIHLDNLIIESEGKMISSIPLSDIAAIVISNPYVILTQAVISRLAKFGGIVVICDDKFQPAAMMLSLDANFVQSERFRKQAQATKPLQKQIWQQIVKAKINAQARSLNAVTGTDKGLKVLTERVASGDSTNMEARASQRYWPALFNNKSFKRDRAQNDQNRFLNYGYAILRAITARAICGAGLHPSLGVHHHNRYDNFCLASDLMEPFRPLVDKSVVKIVAEQGANVEISSNTKRQILSNLMCSIYINGGERSLFTILSKVASSLSDVYSGSRKKIWLPDL